MSEYISANEEILSHGPRMDLSYNNLTSLKGQDIPDIVKEWFNCSRNELTTLEFCPSTVDGNFSCAGNKLSSLEFCPEEVTGDFYCQNNQLTSLEFCPTQVGRTFYCSVNNLTSLKFCPTQVGGSFACGRNQLTSLQSIHKLFQNGYIRGRIAIGDNPIKSHLLGLLLIPELEAISCYADDEYYEAVLIINKHLQGERDVLDCQQELIDLGYKHYAQL